MSKILNLIRPVLGTDGNVTYTSLCKFPINSGAKKKFTLGKEDYIKVSFSTHDELSLNIGDGIDDDNIGVYKLKKRYKPTYDENTDSYKYDLQLDSYYMLWANILMVYNPSVAAGELSFGLTGRLELHSELLKSNLKANGFNYRGLDFVVVIDSANVKNEAKLVECDGTDIISYLNTLCDKDHFNCEWWVVKNIIYFGKCEYDSTTNDGYYNDVEFEIGKNCSSMKANETQDEFANRIYVFGGTNNITGRYRKKLVYKVSDVVDYNSTQKIIKDSSRPLFAYYFKSQEKNNKSYSATNSVGYNVMPKSVQGNDFHVKFDFNSFPCGGLIDFSGIKCSIQLFDANNNLVAPSNIFNYTLDIYVVGQKNDVPVTINHITQTGAIADLSALTDTISISDADCKGFAFPYISFNFTTDIDANTYTNIKRAVWNFSGNAVFSLNSPVINTKLSYNGSVYDVVINHDNSSSTDMNILLPAGLSIPVLGEYTLPNIITGKVPSSQFTAAEGETNNDLVYQGTIQKRLMLPVGTPYIQTDKNLTPEQIKIAILTYDDIYPRFSGQKITSVSSVDHEEKVDGDVTAKYPLYTIGDKNLVFDKNCLLDNSPQIIFKTGLLAGNALSLTYLGTTDGEAQFRIEHNEKLDLPNKVLMPSVGDEYVLNNIDTSYYFADGAGTLEDKAEQELLEQGKKDAKDILNLEDTFDCSMISNVMKKDNISYQIGQKVTLRNNNYFATGTRDSRVIGYEVCLDKPYDKPVYSIGNSVKYSLVADLENKIDKLKFNGSTYYGVAGGSNSSSYSIYVVNKSDTNKLSDTNVMSSLRTIQELDYRALSKQHDDRTEHSIEIGKNFKVDGQAILNDVVAKGIADFQKGIKLNSHSISDIIKSGDDIQDTDTLIMSVAKQLATFMRKDVEDSTDFIQTFTKGIKALLVQSGNYSTGMLGAGFTLKNDANGDSYIEVDRGLFRKTVTFYELLIQKIKSVGGQLLLSDTQMNCIKVEEQADSYRCYFKNNEDGKVIYNEFEVNDLARRQDFNVKTGSKYYWRKVIAIGDDYIDLSKTDCDAGSGVPEVGDDIIQIGNSSDTARQGAIVLSAYGPDSPYIKIYQGINSYSLSGKERATLSPSKIDITADSFKFSTGDSIKDYIDNNVIVPCGNWESGTSYLKNRLVTFNNQTFISTADNSDCPIVVLADENGDYIVDENGNYIAPTDENGNITYNPSWKAYSSSEALEQDVAKFKKDASATFEILNDEINSKVSSATYDMLGRRVGTAESNITQNATDIGLKVSKDGVIGAINLTSEAATINASKINLVGAVTANSIVSGAVTTDKLAAKAATIDKIDTASLTAAQAFIDDFNSNVVNTKRLNVAQIVADGIAAQTINAQNATFENLNVTSASIYNGTIYNLRSPWINAADDLTSIATDNSIMTNGSGYGYQLFTLDWTAASSGRSMQLISRLSTTIQAPSDKWFYVNGNRVKDLFLTDEIAELVGYGGTSTFFGWIVKNRRPLMGHQQYGKPLNILAHGVVTVSSPSSINLNYKMFNGGYMDGTQYTMSVSRLSEGLYRISFPTQWGLGTNYMVIATGYGAVIGSEVSPVKATLKNRNDGYFDVWVSDDSTVNDGSFAFQMFNMNDINYY